ncbi:ABC transporter ATP-binding protein [Rufibacter glacialis]|uniref:ABC transporter ATP-binding protein n=1 Tax=Rufibacter glacialis TaxID=1259555 RepID=A0A5M8QRI2_9BACT|nr:ABC transporter ATP-binding protein [Rufibacter glacialis]KAA6437604.1 ABC transporter ATP-binding protein [Rufibacter glacialis]GGK57911.1 ABC transporter ATP-binding protein [Rufibacter glacialis]
MDQNIVVKALKGISYYLNKSEKRYAFFTFLLLLLASILDVFGLASLVPVIMAASTPSLISSNKYLAYVYEALNFQSEKLFLIFLIVGIFVFFLLKNMFTTWISYKQVKFTSEIAIKIINRQFTKYSNLPFWHFANEGSAKLVNNVLNVPQFFVNGVIRPTFTLLSEVTIILVIILGILIYQPVLFVILIGVLGPSAILTYQLLKKRSAHIGFQLNALRPISYGILSNTFNGFVELKLANKIGDFRNQFVSAQKKTQELEARSYLFSLIPLKIIEMVAILGVVTIFLYSIIIEGSSSLVAIVGLFAAAAYRLMPSVNRLLTSMVTLKQSEIAITELMVFEEFGQPLIGNNSDRPIKFEKEIVFKELSFSFPESRRSTINKINLTIKKGEKVGIIGSSGSGKTTLMNILLRFYVEQKGNILIDGEPLTEENKLSWYDIVSYVKQDTFLMESSIQDNITLGDKHVDQSRLQYAIEQASLKGFVESLPEGVHSLIGERGAKLSGGQKQRIGIARALYKNTQVLVLDEATSALDTNTEREVSEAIDRLSQTDITIFIIAHRITTLRDCDRIFEMDKGRIVSERSYEDVIKEVV